MLNPTFKSHLQQYYYALVSNILIRKYIFLFAFKSMGGWDDDEFSAQEVCETASATGGSADTIKFKWDSDPCQRQSVTKCRSIYFR